MNVLFLGSISIVMIPVALVLLYDITSLLPKNNKFTALLICKVIPGRCPFARHVEVGKISFDIPPLCKLNPLYNFVSMNRFKALSYLADHEQEFKINMETLL